MEHEGPHAAEAHPDGGAMTYPLVSLYALMLAAAGLPLYIHLPQFASVQLGINLAALGVILLVVRLFDLVQDPVIGWIIDRWPRAQGIFGLAAALGLAAGFPLLFGLERGEQVVMQLVACLLLLYTSYSLGSILLYSRSASLARRPGPAELVTVATYREVGSLAGVVLAAIAPSALVALGASAAGYPAFGIALGLLAVATGILSRPIWRRPPPAGRALSSAGLAESGALRLLVLGLVNGLPLAITSTLFLFFVEDRLALAGAAGPLLILFFLGAGLSIPVWSRVARAIGARTTLGIAMPLAILSFAGSALLQPGDLWLFAAICLVSGAALGAETLLLPAMFSIALARSGLQASLAFGIWALAGKLGLSVAAFIVMPMLAWQGYVPNQPNDAAALAMLTFLYAVLPCGLKVLGTVLVWRLPKESGAMRREGDPIRPPPRRA